MNSGGSDLAGAVMTRQWGFIGSGKMATALIKGMLRAGIAPIEAIRASDPLPAARALLEGETGVRVYDSNLPVVQQSDVVVLAVKPQSMRAAAGESPPRCDVLSTSSSRSQRGSRSPRSPRGSSPVCGCVRVMPNTPALVGEGASAFAAGPGVRPEDERVVKSFLDSVGQTVGVAESLLDAVTGLSGSGPAFVYLMIEALSDGGVRAGLPREVATLLAAQTVLGAARMVSETGLHPGVLKDQVASPGGTTIAGLNALERAAVRGALIDAVEAAARRSAELAALAGPTP